MGIRGLLFGAAVSFGLTGPGWADDSATPLFGRISAIDGAVLYHSPEGAWGPALINEPVAAGVGLRVPRDAEAEWRDPGARIALAPASELRVLRLDGAVLQLALLNGRIGIHLDEAASTRTVEIDLPHGGVWLDAPGDYDIVAGDAKLAPAIQVIAGKARVGGGLDDAAFIAAAADRFSAWWRAQDNGADLTAGEKSANVPGTAALAGAGRWEHYRRLGDVWFPGDIAEDWVPYRDGAWRYLPPWGWTWIDSAPWGFAPSHYGRWARIGDRWGWVPGSELDAADYSPAVVAFLGTAGIGLSRPGDIGATPAVAWFPLAPEETIDAEADADGRYKNRRFATAMARPAFAAGMPALPAMIDDVPSQRFADAPIILGGLNIAPLGDAPRQPRKTTAAAVAAPPGAPGEPARQPYFVALRTAPPPRPAAHEPHKRVRTAGTGAHARPLASPAHSPHNRTHLAAARGGA
jgi:hypothetical protein